MTAYSNLKYAIIFVLTNTSKYACICCHRLYAEMRSYLTAIGTKPKQISSAYKDLRTSGNPELSQTHLAISIHTPSIQFNSIQFNSVLFQKFLSLYNFYDK